jgi:hypothetical protein
MASRPSAIARARSWATRQPAARPGRQPDRQPQAQQTTLGRPQDHGTPPAPATRRPTPAGQKHHPCVTASSNAWANGAPAQRARPYQRPWRPTICSAPTSRASSRPATAAIVTPSRSAACITSIYLDTVAAIAPRRASAPGHTTMTWWWPSCSAAVLVRLMMAPLLAA